MMAAKTWMTSAPASAALAAWSIIESVLGSSGVVLPMSWASMAAKNVVYDHMCIEGVSKRVWEDDVRRTMTLISCSLSIQDCTNPFIAF